MWSGSFSTSLKGISSAGALLTLTWIIAVTLLTSWYENLKLKH